MMYATSQKFEIACHKSLIQYSQVAERTTLFLNGVLCTYVAERPLYKHMSFCVKGFFKKEKVMFAQGEQNAAQLFHRTDNKGQKMTFQQQLNMTISNHWPLVMKRNWRLHAEHQIFADFNRKMSFFQCGP